jgi:protein SCO1/2
MTALAATSKQLATLPEQLRPQVVMISVDPERDTPERLADYVKAFDPSFVGATGTKAEIDEFALRMGVGRRQATDRGRQLQRRSHDFGVSRRSRRRAARAVLGAARAAADRGRLSADHRRMTAAPTIRAGDRWFAALQYICRSACCRA